ncbi:MAG: hypothetical protein M3332_16340 [Actinomycetota bacterium]|nr:hypothetical protein [Actinomycetota bacterium]
MAVTLVLVLGLVTYAGSAEPGFTAFLALLGVGVTAGISALVTVQSNRRLAQEHADDRERLRLDAAMRAGSLLAPSADSRTSPPSAAAGLLALTQLDHAELAVALLVDLWSEKSENLSEVSDETAVLVIDAALREESSNAPLIAAELLCRNAGRLDPCQSLHWPSAIDGRWVPQVSPRTKLLLLEALVSMTLKGEVSENALRSLAVRLFGIWDADTDENVKGCVGSLIKSIVPALEELAYKNFLHGPMNVSMDEIRSASRTAHRNPDDYLARIVDCRCELLEAWSINCRGRLSRRSGALADSSCDRADEALVRSNGSSWF